MKLINKIKKWLEGPIMYNEYMNNLNLNVSDLNENEYKDIKEKLEMLLKQKNIIVSEEDKIKHIKKEINIFDWYNKEDFFPTLTYEEIKEINHGGKIPTKYICIKNLSYNDRMLKCLLFYFMNISQLKNKYSDYFIPYLRYVLHFYDITPTKSELNKFLNGEISFNQIRDRWEEFEQSNKTDEDYNRIINNGLI